MIQIDKGEHYWDYPAHIRVCTINCKGVMGKGIALEFAQRYPALALKVKNSALSFQRYRPGVIYHEPCVSDGTVVWLATTKDDWRYPSKMEWIESIANDIMESATWLGPHWNIAVPALGCSNGGLQWEKVLAVILAAHKKHKPKPNFTLFAPIGHSNPYGNTKKGKR